MMTIRDILNLLEWLLDPARHWFVAFLAGLLGFSLMWIISSVPFAVLRLGLRRRVSSDVGFFILLCSLLAMLSAVVLSHYVLDYGSMLWHMPLGPPLELVIP
jgi:hypothetical protein